MNFFSKYKRVIMIIVFLSFVAGIGYLLYVYFFRSAQESIEPTTPPVVDSSGRLITSPDGSQAVTTDPGTIPVTTPSTPTTIQPDEKAAGGVTKSSLVVENPVLKPTIGRNGSDVNYYDKSDGKFYRIDENGQKIPLSDRVFYNVSDITWSPTKDKAVLEYPDGSNIVYNFNTGKQVTLPKHWEDFDFSPSGDKLVMKSIGLDVENRWLAVSNDDGSGAIALEQLGKNAGIVLVGWSPNDQIVAMYPKGVDLNRQEVFFVGLNQENFKSTIVNGRGFIPSWSKEGDRLAYSVYTIDGDMKPEIWVVDAQGDSIGSNRKRLNVQTWADKCVFADNENMYCGVPEYLPEGAGLFPELAKDTRDNLFKINVRTGEKELIAIPDQDHNIGQLIISQDGKNLYFTDNNTSLVHRVGIE